MIKLALVSYLNTRPFLDGLEKEYNADEIELKLLPPHLCAQALLNGEVDGALVPIGAISEMENIEILKDHCIGTPGEVASVLLLAEKPVEELTHVFLDPHSRTSNALAQILFRDLWKTPVKTIAGSKDHYVNIQGSTGAVVIGDLAIKIREKYPVCIDLGRAWMELTGFPMVFAVWAFKKGKVSESDQLRISKALEAGRLQSANSAKKWAETYGMTAEDAEKYLTEYIDLKFDAPKHESLRIFLEKFNSLEISD